MTQLNSDIKDYVASIKLMQLATSNIETKRPWLCSVWYVMDDKSNVYWISRTTRRHSQEIEKNPQATCTILKDFTEGLGEKGRALILSGKAELVPKDKIEFVYNLYANEYEKTQTMQNLETFLNGDGPHFLYQLVPDEIVWWDELEVQDNPRIKIL